MVSGCSSATGQLLKCLWEERNDPGLTARVQLVVVFVPFHKTHGGLCDPAYIPGIIDSL